MEPLEEHLKKFSLRNNGTSGVQSTGRYNKPFGQGKVATLVSNLEDVKKCEDGSGGNTRGLQYLMSPVGGSVSPQKTGPIVPPKPQKKQANSPEVPQSCLIKPICEPLYSQRLQYLNTAAASAASNCNESANISIKAQDPPSSLLLRKQPIYAGQNSIFDKTSKVTLDNPAILEQQLEALAHHKKQLEKRGLLQCQTDEQKPLANIPKLSSTSLIGGEMLPNNKHSNVYTNMRPLMKNSPQLAVNNQRSLDNTYTNLVLKKQYKPIDSSNATPTSTMEKRNNIYSNIYFEEGFDDLPPPSAALSEVDDYSNCQNEDEIPPPPSPVSSSYSELRQATEGFSKKGIPMRSIQTESGGDVLKLAANRQAYSNMNYGTDCSGYGSTHQMSSTYESIYEPINPRPPSQQSSRSNYLLYSPYYNGAQLLESNPNVMTGSNSSSDVMYNNSKSMLSNHSDMKESDSNATLNSELNMPKKAEVKALTDDLVQSIDSCNDIESYGICSKCNERVVGENSGCTAMDQIYHIACFTCSQCQINLQGKPFYALEGKPFCEYDYLQTLEKCSVCMKPILERILRATGKPYHPQCFTCVVCGNSLDGIPFTVDATNQNYCIEDFHRKFAPRCCVCREPIMPEPGEEETVRVVALDRSFHFECYKCEDCGLLLSSEAEGRGCYPLDDHVLCKNCNARRVQMLTNRMTTDL